MVKKLKPAIVLTSICLMVALLLSVINMFTAPVIKEKENLKANAALLEVLPIASSFEQLDVASIEGMPAAVIAAWKAPEGYVFKTSTSGWAAGMILMVGVDSEGKIAGSKCLSANETYGLQNKLDGEYNGTDFGSLELILAAGASAQSMTSKGYYDGVMAALQAFATVSGGDARTQEQIFNDNCNIVLGLTEKTFKKAFVADALTGIDAIYTTDNAEDGVVMLAGETLIGVKNGAADLCVGAYDPEGLTSPVSDENKANADAAYLIYTATPTELTRPEGISSTVKKISITANGNYVLEVVTDGCYNMDGEWAHGEDSYIYFTVSISADGKIIDIVTTKHGESKGYGDVCATEAFYETYRGATAADVVVLAPDPDDMADQIPAGTEGPGVIAGATFTTTYYQQAVLDAFAAVEAIQNTAEGE